MLNIISRAWARPEAGAVHKVARNLVAGLERLDHPFVINRPIEYCSRIWIHDDYRAIMALPKKNPGLKPLIGPNLFVLPRDIPWTVKIPDYCVYLQPSEWTARLWTELGYNRTPIDFWPVGIDTSNFNKHKKTQKSRILFYYKSRDKIGENGADRIEATLHEMGLTFTRINYGTYLQEDYLSLLGESKFVIWYGRQESQGLALQEALAMGCPVLVVDTKIIGDSEPKGYRFTKEESQLSATSAPYFDLRCGLIINDLMDLRAAIKIMESKHRAFDPASFIAENLTIEKAALNLLRKFDKWWPAASDFENKNLTENFAPPSH